MDYEESLMIKAAWYYYFEELTQQHVAELMGITRMPVSYTHLDVYKRQLHGHAVGVHADGVLDVHGHDLMAQIVVEHAGTVGLV